MVVCGVSLLIFVFFCSVESTVVVVGSSQLGPSVAVISDDFLDYTSLAQSDQVFSAAWDVTYMIDLDLWIIVGDPIINLTSPSSIITITTPLLQSRPLQYSIVPRSHFFCPSGRVVRYGAGLVKVICQNAEKKNALQLPQLIVGLSYDASASYAFYDEISQPADYNFLSLFCLVRDIRFATKQAIWMAVGTSCSGNAIAARSFDGRLWTTLSSPSFLSVTQGLTSWHQIVVSPDTIVLLGCCRGSPGQFSGAVISTEFPLSSSSSSPQDVWSSALTNLTRTPDGTDLVTGAFGRNFTDNQWVFFTNTSATGLLRVAPYNGISVATATLMPTSQGTLFQPSRAHGISMERLYYSESRQRYVGALTGGATVAHQQLLDLETNWNEITKPQITVVAAASDEVITATPIAGLARSVAGVAVVTPGTRVPINTTFMVRSINPNFQDLAFFSVYGLAGMGSAAKCDIDVNTAWNGNVTFDKDAKFRMNGTLFLNPGSELVVQIDVSDMIPGTQVLFPIANAARVVGRLSSVKAILRGGGGTSISINITKVVTTTTTTTSTPLTTLIASRSPQQRDVITVASCPTISDATPQYGSSSLSVLVTITDPCNPTPASTSSNSSSSTTTTTASSSSGLSTGAIVGIAIGATVGGILIAVGIILLTKYLIQSSTNQQMHELAIKNSRV